MTKKVLPLFLLIAFLLAACGNATEASKPTATVEPTATEAESTESEQTATQEPLTDTDNPCMLFNVIDYYQYPNLPPVTSDDWSTGPENAGVTFIIYTDPQCPYCAQLNAILAQLQEMYPDDVRIITRFFPLTSIHDKALLAAQAIEASGKQGKYEELKNFLFDHLRKDIAGPNEANLPDSSFWNNLEPGDFENWLMEQVPALSIDTDQLIKDMNSDEIVASVQSQEKAAINLGVSGTPAIFINGSQFNDNWQDVSTLSSYVEVYARLIESQKIEFDSCPPAVTDPDKSYSATITTTQGDIVVDLFNDEAPVAVNSFVYLAQEGWYDNLSFLVYDDYLVTGDPSETGWGGPGYAFLDEVNNNLNFNEPGMLAVYSPNPGYGLNGSMFFINRTSLTDVGNFTIFGKVTDGLSIIDNFTNRSSFFDPVLDQVLSITITEK